MECPSRFFKKIVGAALSEGLDVEFRCLHPLRDKESLTPKQFWCRSLKDIERTWPDIEDLNAHAYDINFTVVPRKPVLQGKKEHPLPDRPFVSCFWADLDVGEGKPYETVDEALRHVQALKPLPNIIIESGNGVHPYYILKKPRYMSRERFERLLRCLAALLRGDMGAARATRLMRVPNTFNCKDVKHRKLAKITFFARENYRLRDLKAAWNVIRDDASHAEQKPNNKQESKTKQKRWQEGIYAELFTTHVKKLTPVGGEFEALGLCPFHDDKKPSFCVNVNTGLWKCQSSECGEQGNVQQFCAKLDIPIPATGVYVVENGHMCVIRQTKDGPVTIDLCNFEARVTEEITLDDGVDPTRAFVIEGSRDDGEKLPATRVPAANFAGLNWVTKDWGVQAIVNAGFAKRDQAREAIQRLSPTPTRRSIYTHTGWREVNGKQVFLTSNGAIGGEEVEVELATDLQRYRLPAEPDNPREAMRVSLGLLEIAPYTITIPLWAAMYRAPLCIALPADFSEFIEGKTGSLKSTLTALSLCHFGDFDAKSLPGSWESTANSLEHRAFVLKDLPFVIDDYAPKPHLGFRDMEAKAARLLRAQGNLSGRGRLRADVTERPAHPPRGIIISTGEQHPPGQSVIARTLLMLMEKKMVDLRALTRAQKESALLPHAMSGYIHWLAPWIHNSRPTLLQILNYMKAQAEGKGHLRIPEILAHLYVGLYFGTLYAEHIGACLHADAERIRGKGLCALLTLGDSQARAIEVEQPTQRFLQVIFTLLTQHRAQLISARKSDYNREPQRESIGWYDDDYIYLQPEAAYEAVSRFCRDSNDPFVTREGRLRRDLHEEGLSEISEKDKEHFTANKRLGGKQRRVISLHRDAVEQFVGEQLPCDGVTGVTGTWEEGVLQSSDQENQSSSQEESAAGGALHKKPVTPVTRRFPRFPLRFPRLPETA